MEPDEITTVEVEAEPKHCRMCEVFGGILGVTLGVVLLFIGFDILTGGGLSTMISGGKEGTE